MNGSRRRDHGRREHGARALREVVRLAWRDFLHDGRISTCVVLALMAVLAPLLLLFGLRFGVIDTIAVRLVEDPRNREILGAGSGHFDEEWFQAMQARRDVAFIVPSTRRLAASFNALVDPVTDTRLSGVQMIPTAPGDPLLAGMPAIPAGQVPADQLPVEHGEIILSEPAARKLGVGAGADVTALIQRQRGGDLEAVSLPLHVTGIAPASAFPDEAAFVRLDLLVATEDYRDGFAVPHLGWPGDDLPSARRVYPRFRLYATSIYDVAGLRDALAGMGIEVRTKADEVAAMQALDRNLGLVFWLLAAIGTSGFLASLAASLVANVERKRRELSVLRLVGFPTGSIIAFPMVQAGLVGLIGAAVALLAYAGVALVLNGLFTASLRAGERICRLLPEHVVAAIAGTLLCAVAASAWAGLRAARIEPAEGIRDV
jgi:putative ABC transport system permease protein